jgi:hypothetical protein
MTQIGCKGRSKWFDGFKSIAGSRQSGLAVSIQLQEAVKEVWRLQFNCSKPLKWFGGFNRRLQGRQRGLTASVRVAEV